MARKKLRAAALTPSGPQWVSQFPNSNRVEDLKEPFRTQATNFLNALRKSNASIEISSTYRPPERAYLMHYAYLVAKGLVNPADVPARRGVNIDWTHGGDPAASRRAAQEMVAAYDIVYAPALSSRHTQGMAIDMDIGWPGELILVRPGTEEPAIIQSLPRSDANQDLHNVGAEYGVYKLISDPPHWSADGH